MIDNETRAQQLALQAQNRRVEYAQRAALEESGFTDVEVARAMEPVLSFHAQLDEEIAAEN